MSQNQKGIRGRIAQFVNQFRGIRQNNANVAAAGDNVMAAAALNYNADAIAAKAGAAVHNVYVMDGLIDAAEAAQPAPVQALGAGLLNLRADGGYQRAAIHQADQAIKEKGGQ